MALAFRTGEVYAGLRAPTLEVQGLDLVIHNNAPSSLVECWLCVCPTFLINHTYCWLFLIIIFITIPGYFL